jgi:hypothetical protein
MVLIVGTNLIITRWCEKLLLFPKHVITYKNHIEVMSLLTGNYILQVTT